MTRDWRRPLSWTAALAVLAGYTLYSAGSVTHGFVSYYAAARLLVEGSLGPLAYDDAWFGAYVQAVTHSSVREIFVPNPPTMAVMALPIAWLDAAPARAVWLLASLGSLAIAAAALMRDRASRPTGLSALVLLVMLLNPSVFANLRIGQGYLFVMALFAATALLLVRRRDGLAGACLGLLLVLKTAGAALLVVLVAQRRFRVVGAAVAVAVAIALLVTPSIDPQMWLVYPTHVHEYVIRPASSVTAYQTTLGLFRHLCVGDARWNPSPAADCGVVAFALPTILIVAALLVTIAAAARARGSDRAWIAAAICLSELSLPAAAEPHFALLAVPLALLDLRPAALAVVAALMLVPLEYSAEAFTSGWASLLAYPRLYAAWLLWGLSIRELLVGGNAGVALAPQRGERAS